MVIVSIKPNISKNNNAFYSASASNKQNPQDGTLDLPFFFRYKHITSLKTTFRLHKARACPAGFRATSAAVFVLIYWLREFHLSAFANRFELRCEPKQLMLLYYKICPCYVTETAFTRYRNILKTVKNVTDRPPVHTKTAQFLPADFENCRF